VGFELKIETGVEQSILGFLDRIPVISLYADTRGWPFIIAWLHRICGLLLVGYLWFHLYTLLSLSSPPRYDATMKFYGFLLFRILEWALAIPVIFHAANGGRLILYESFETRDDGAMIRWVVWLSILYGALLGALMLIGTQNVTALFFWLAMLVAGLALAYGVASKIWTTENSPFWKFQRITGAYLLILIPAHMLFMHLNYAMAHEANTVLMRMQGHFIKAVDISLVVVILYHAGYGLLSFMGDYLASQTLRIGLAALVILVMLLFAVVGVKLTIFI
jgi:succinate dehydrogenase hydrophobic anchor subunit